MDGSVLVLGGAVLALMIITCVIAARRARARRRRLQLWADYHGWAIQRNPSVPWAQRLPGSGGRVSVLRCSGWPSSSAADQ